MALLRSPMLITIVVIFTAHIQLSKPEISARYLYGGPRLSNDSFIDYYFSCNVVGNSLQVFVNWLSAGGFSSSESGTVRTGSYSNFSYSTALVSVKDIHQETYQYDSIIIVSVKTINYVEVHCTGRLGSASANNSGGIVNQNNIIDGQSAADSSGQLMIEQLFSGQVVQDQLTYAFICGVQRPFQTWRIGNDSNHFSFADFNKIGETRPFPSGSPSTVHNLAFLCAREPYQIVTIMLLTGRSINLSVTCSAGRYRAHVSIADLTKPRTTSTPLVTTYLSEKPSSTTMAPEYYATTSTQQMSSPLNEAQEDFPTTIVGVIAGVLVAFGVAVFTVVVVVLLICTSAKRNKVKQNSHNRSDEVHAGEVKLSLEKEYNEVKISTWKRV